jgi:hypothetical protein
MTIIDRRHLLSSFAATTVCAGVAPRIDSAGATEQLNAERSDNGQNKCRAAWFIARQDRETLGGHAVEFWTKPFCDIRHADFLPRAIVRGVLWYNYAEFPYCTREPEVLDFVDSVFRQDRSDWLNNPRQFAEHLGETGNLSPPLLSLLGGSNPNERGLRVALIALDSQSLCPMDPDWADVLPAFRRCFDRVIGHFHFERRGFRQWKAWLARPFGGSYFEHFFSKAVAQCDAVVFTSPALVETDVGLCPAASTEMLAGEQMRRLGYALLRREVLEQIVCEDKVRPPRFFALGSATLRAPFDPLMQFHWTLRRQRALVSSSFGQLLVDDLPLTAISIEKTDELAWIPIRTGYSDRLEILTMKAPRYQGSVLDAASSTVDDWLNKLVSDASEHIRTLEVEQRQFVNAYYGPIWIWLRLQDERWKMARISLRTGSRPKPFWHVDHLVPVKIWDDMGVPTEPNGDSQENSLIPAHALGNCHLLESSFSVSKGKDELQVFLGKVYEFQTAEVTVDEWCAALSIPAELRKPTSFPTKAVIDAVTKRTDAIRSELLAYVDGSKPRIDGSAVLSSLNQKSQSIGSLYRDFREFPAIAQSVLQINNTSIEVLSEWQN